MGQRPLTVSSSITAKMGPKLVFRQVSQRLPVDRFERSFIHFFMHGMVRVWRVPPESKRRNLTWLPRCASISNPKREKILTRSPPETVLSFGVDERLKFEAGEDGRVRGKIELRQIFALEVKSQRFLEISCQLVQGSPLGYDGKIKALRHILLFPLRDAHLDNLLHVHVPSVPQHSLWAN